MLAVPDKDPRFNHMASLRDVPEHVLREITNFFEVGHTRSHHKCFLDVMSVLVSH